MSRPRIVIAGGGFAGLACAQGLDAADFEVTLVDQRRHLDFIPNIHELISGTKRKAQLTLPLGAILHSLGHRFRQGVIREVDSRDRSLTLEDGRRFSADYLLLALGSKDASFGVDGVGRHTLGLKSVAEGQAVNRRLRQLGRATTRTRVVVVGSGLAGIEALGEILRLPWRGHRDIHLVEAAPRLLPSGPPRVSTFLRTRLEAQGVQLHLADAVQRISAKTVWLKSGKRLRSDATLWTAGPAPGPVLATSGLAGPGEWMRVNRDLSAQGVTGVYAAGDIAELPTALTRQAYHALDMGTAAAQNIARDARGLAGRPFRPVPRPTLLAFGDMGCILIAGQKAVFSPALGAAKEGVYAAVMAKLDQRKLAPRLSGALSRAQGSAGQLWPLLKPTELLRGAAQLRTL
jgi:NADH dehydrogenase FAD-containing subunit